jgi:hypothetical protein
MMMTTAETIKTELHRQFPKASIVVSYADAVTLGIKMCTHRVEIRAGVFTVWQIHLDPRSLTWRREAGVAGDRPGKRPERAGSSGVETHYYVTLTSMQDLLDDAAYWCAQVREALVETPETDAERRLRAPGVTA